MAKRMMCDVAPRVESNFRDTCKVSMRVPCFVWREEGDPSQMRVKSLGVVHIIEDYTVR
jgi:hypothetical protein